MDCYAKEPLCYTKTGIPIFSLSDFYTENNISK
jgi:hypothetical protein